MITVGVLGLAGAVGCVVAFVVATVRADARVRALDPAATSRFVGWPRAWALAATLLSVGSVLVLVAAVTKR